MERANPELLADLARLWARYSREEVLQAIRLLTDPAEAAAFGDLIATSSRAPRPHQSRARGRPKQVEPIDPLAEIRASSPENIPLVEEILTGAAQRWSRARGERIAEITGKNRLPAVNGKTTKARIGQLLGVVRLAPRPVLVELAEEFRQDARSTGSLQEWADIILRDRAPKEPGQKQK